MFGLNRFLNWPIQGDSNKFEPISDDSGEAMTMATGNRGGGVCNGCEREDGAATGGEGDRARGEAGQ